MSRRQRDSETRWARRPIIGCLVLAIVVVAVPAVAGAYQRTRIGSGAAKPYFDIRAGLPTSAAVPVAPSVKSSQRKLARSLGHDAVVQTDPLTGTVHTLQDLGAPLTSASAADPRDRAWSYVRANVRALGLDSGDLSSFSLASRSMTRGGLTSLRWKESYRGIPAFDNDLRVNVDRLGQIINVLGSPLHNLSLDSITPSLSATQAVDALMRNVGVRRNMRVTSGPSGVRQVTDFSTGDFARLVIFGGAGAPRLAWHLTYAASSIANYDAVIDADTGQVLYRQNLTKFASNASVWTNYPGAPAGGTQTLAVNLEAPTTASPNGYLNPSATTLIGPNVHAFSDVNDDDIAQASEEVNHFPSGTDFNYPFTSFNGSATDGGCSASAICSWDGDLDVDGSFLSPTSWTTNQHQNAVQTFWFANNFHDHLASVPIGFVSPQNFEGNDPLQLNADDGADTGGDGGPDANHLDNANMTTRPVGLSPKMQMFLFNFDVQGAPFRDINGGDDARILYHEYTHGLSGRLITNSDGSEAVSSPEAGAMGEAWSDWYAMDYLVRTGDEADTATAGEIDMGKYSDATPNTIRTQPLDCPVGAASGPCPGGPGGYTFGDFGQVIGIPEVHADGEIWSETLWDLRTALIAQTGDATTGSNLAEQLITDAMRLSPPEPSYLDERNAILGAVTADLSGPAATTTTNTVWTVFRNRGMGFFAGAADGSDIAPVEDFTAPPAPGGPTGTISGTVTSADTGLPVSGLSVGIGGLAINPSPVGPLVGTTDASGHYSFSGVPVGTYGKLVAFTAAGFDQDAATHVAVSSGGNAVQNFAIHRDWAASKGGANITQVSDNTGADFGCGADQLIDQTQGIGWSAFNPTSADPSNPHHGNPTVTIQLPQAINVRAFLADPGNTCGDGASSTTKGYKIETSTNGATFTVASQGNFAPADAHRLNQLTPTGGTTGVRFVRLTLLSPQNTGPGFDGTNFIDFTELEVLGGPPNALPSGSLVATPSSIAPGGTVLFNASSFHDPDSLITGYSWDFDGNGTTDATTPGPTTAHRYPVVGKFAARVTANDFVGGGGSAGATVTVTKKPIISIASRGKHGKLTLTITCSAPCRATATATISKKLRKRYHLHSRTVAKRSVRLTKAGKKRVTLTITKKVRKTLKRRHVKQLAVSVRLVVTDSIGARATKTRHAKIRL